MYNIIVAYKAVLFDLDGTLLDTLRDIADSTDVALAKLGFPGHDLQTYRGFMGKGMAALALKALPESSRNPDAVSQLLVSIGKEYAVRWTVHTHPYPGIFELLDAIVAKGIMMAILSNKPHEFTLEQVEKLLPHCNFDEVMGSFGAIPLKPDPTGALAISRKLRISPLDFIYLGDTEIDMKTAMAAGMHPVGALWGFRTGEELLAGGAWALIQHPTELLSLITRMNS